MSSLFDKLSADEQRLLDCYESQIQEKSITRSVDDMTFDKLFLLAEARLRTANGNDIDDSYIANQINHFTQYPKDYTYWLDTLVDKFYESQKTTSYNATENDDLSASSHRKQNFINYTTNNTNAMTSTSSDESQWIFRSPIDHNMKKNDHRWAINARADIELIKKLDEFAKKHDMHYKIANSQNWNSRMDSIVIYSPHPKTKEETEELKQIVAPYIRRSRPELTNKMDGEMVADGLFVAKEMDKQQCINLCFEIKKVHPELANIAARKVKENLGSNPYNPLSLGEFQNLSKIMGTLLSEKAKAKSRYLRSQIQTSSTAPVPTPAPALAQQKTDKTNDAQTSTIFKAQLDKGMKDIKLPPESRLSFAPNIEKVSIQRDKNGVIHIIGKSADGKQSVHFEYGNKNAKIEIINEEMARSYRCENGTNWSFRDLKSPTGTRYMDNSGVEYAKEFSGIMEIAKYQTEMIARATMQTTRK